MPLDFLGSASGFLLGLLPFVQKRTERNNILTVLFDEAQEVVRTLPDTVSQRSRALAFAPTLSSHAELLKRTDCLNADVIIAGRRFMTHVRALEQSTKKRQTRQQREASVNEVREYLTGYLDQLHQAGASYSHRLPTGRTIKPKR